MGNGPSEQPDPERLKALEERLEEVKRAHAPKPRVDKDLSHGDMAWRMVIEMISGLGIGFGIGYGLDVLFGTLPWFMLIFTLLGFAAGVKVMLRSAQQMGKEPTAAAEAPEVADEEGK